MLKKIRNCSIGIFECSCLYLAFVVDVPEVTLGWLIMNSRGVQCAIALILASAFAYILTDRLSKARKRRKIQARKRAHLLRTDAPYWN